MRCGERSRTKRSRRKQGRDRAWLSQPKLKEWVVPRPYCDISNQFQTLRVKETTSKKTAPKTRLHCASAYFSTGHSQATVDVLTELNGPAECGRKPRSVWARWMLPIAADIEWVFRGLVKWAIERQVARTGRWLFRPFWPFKKGKENTFVLVWLSS